jgi:hypothetical protein
MSVLALSILPSPVNAHDAQIDTAGDWRTPSRYDRTTGTFITRGFA